jgi:formamidopyrimidine-DNA glycosylase
MPELPEVEWMRREASRALGRRILSVESPDSRFSAPQASGTLVAVQRFGKTLGLCWSQGAYSLQPRMTGRLLWARPEDLRFVRVFMRFEGIEPALVLDDPRRLAVGRNEGDLDEADLAQRLQEGLGPEPWPVALRGTQLAERLGATRSPLKVALMDPARIAGVGNIGANEACFSAGILPDRSVGSLELADWERLSIGIFSWVESALADLAGSSLELLHGGKTDNPFWVYGRANETCGRCGGRILRTVLGGRGTFACRGCQR